jgi:hypothetical protein
MKLAISLLCIFALIITIGAPPVVENPNKNVRQADAKDEKDSEDVVRTNTFFLFIQLIFLSFFF